jgi:hypothetical protein
MLRSDLTVSLFPFQNNRSVAFFNQNGKPIAVDLITNDGGTIVAAGGVNLVSAVGGNVISPNGSNISTLKGVSFGGRYQVLAAGSTLIPTSGKGALIIR